MRLSSGRTPEQRVAVHLDAFRKEQSPLTYETLDLSGDSGGLVLLGAWFGIRC